MAPRPRPLSLADLILVPVSPSGLDLRAAERTLALLRQARKVRRDGKPAALLVPSRVDRRTAAGREIEAVLHDMGEPVAPAIIQRAAHVDAFSAGQWIGAYAPRSAGHVEIQSLAALVRKDRHPMTKRPTSPQHRHATPSDEAAQAAAAVAGAPAQQEKSSPAVKSDGHDNVDNSHAC